jgi:hypothetical protein
MKQQTEVEKLIDTFNFYGDEMMSGRSAMKDLMEAVEQDKEKEKQQSAPTWISVEDRLPEVGSIDKHSSNMVSVYCEDEGALFNESVGYYCYLHKRWVLRHWDQEKLKVLFFKPLTKPLTEAPNK